MARLGAAVAHAFGSPEAIALVLGEEKPVSEAVLMVLDDVRDVQPPPFEEVKPQLQRRLQQQKIERHVLDLREKAKVE